MIVQAPRRPPPASCHCNAPCHAHPTTVHTVAPESMFVHRAVRDMSPLTPRQSAISGHKNLMRLHYLRARCHPSATPHQRRRPCVLSFNPFFSLLSFFLPSAVRTLIVIAIILPPVVEESTRLEAVLLLFRLFATASHSLLPPLRSPRLTANRQSLCSE